MNPLFKLGEAGDSKDFIIFILEQLHNELKKSFNDKKNTPDPLDQYNKDNTLQNFLYEFKGECSIISDVFFGIYETTNVCLNCKKNYNSKNLNNPICYNYGIFNCLIFPLEEVKNMKLKNNANQIMENSNNVVNMNDCFDFYQKNELFTGDNKNYCNICQQLFDSIYTTKIYTSPNFLILILNRGKGKKYNVKLDFPEILNITQYVMVKEIPNIIYNLYGVVTHIGESGPNAHFVASCKSPVDGKWYRYNDAIVNSISDLKREVIDFGTPYILFYQKNK
jgi:ubiquitin C-terminal hydrolase